MFQTKKLSTVITNLWWCKYNYRKNDRLLKKQSNWCSVWKKPKALCEKISLIKKVINSKKSHATTIQEYRKVIRIVKKEVKKAKWIQLDEKIQKLEDDFRKNYSHNLFKSVGELEGNPRKSLMVIKTKMQIKGLKQMKFLKFGKRTLNSMLIRNFLMMKVSYNLSLRQCLPLKNQQRNW